MRVCGGCTKREPSSNFEIFVESLSILAKLSETAYTEELQEAAKKAAEDAAKDKAAATDADKGKDEDKKTAAKAAAAKSQAAADEAQALYTEAKAAADAAKAAKKAAADAEKDKAAATEADKGKDEAKKTAAKAAAAQPQAAADEAQASQSKRRIYSQPVGGNQHATASKVEISKAEWEVAVKGKYGWKLKGQNKWATRAGPTKCECESHSRITKNIGDAIDKKEEFCRKCDKEEDGPVPVAPGVAFSTKNGEDGVVKRAEKEVVIVTVNGEDIEIKNNDIISYFIPAWTKADLQVYLLFWQDLFLWSARTGGLVSAVTWRSRCT